MGSTSRIVDDPSDRLIARVITRMNVGGPARHVLALTKGLQVEFPADLFVGTPEPDEGEVELQGLPVTRIPMRRRISPVDDIRSHHRLRQLLPNYALVDSHMSKAGALARFAAKGVSPKPATVHTFHGHVLDGYFGPSISRGFVEIERRLARRSDALIAVSPEIREQLQAHGIGHPEQWHVIPLGFDLAPFAGASEAGARERLGLPPDALLIGMFGRLVPVKGYDLAIASLRAITDAHLVIFGDGRERDRLKALAETMELQSRVHFAGWTDDVPSAMKTVDVVLNTSRQEGTPVALIEAAAAGRAIVAVDVGGVRHVVRDGETGRLIPRDEHEIARALRELLESEPLRARLGTTAQKEVLDRFAISTMLRATAAVYRRVLEDRT